jgi:hypothetical protein
MGKHIQEEEERIGEIISRACVGFALREGVAREIGGGFAGGQQIESNVETVGIAGSGVFGSV